MCESLLKKNNSFWNIWNSRFRRRQRLPTNVAGLTHPREIADGFANYLSNVCKPSQAINSSAADGLRDALIKFPEVKALACEPTSVSQLDNIIFHMRRGKASDVDGLTVEHYQFAHPSGFVLLKQLFNYCLNHGVVPVRFGLGVTVPIPKDSSYKNNYYDL